MDDWPTCPERMAGDQLTCVLPEHHAMDGQPMHRDPTGTLWIIDDPEMDESRLTIVLEGF